MAGLREDVSAIKATLPNLAKAADLSKVEAALPHFATKADLYKLETTMIRWFVGTALGVGALAFGAAKLVS